MLRPSGNPSWIVIPALLLGASCGGTQAPKKMVAPTPETVAPAEPATGQAADASVADAQQSAGEGSAEDRICASAAKTASRGMGVRGITGSLNRGDVQEAMDTRTDALLQCMNERPRGLRFIGGRIDFRIKVGADGRVCEARPIHSTIGYRRLEKCITEVVEQTQLPLPDGRDRTEIEWGMNVEPDRGRQTEELDPATIVEAMKSYAGETYKTCEIRRRDRFEITAYAGRRGRFIALGVLPMRSVEAEKLDCLVQEIKQGWKLPKLKYRSKATFTLKWKPIPPKRKRYVRSKKNKRRRGRSSLRTAGFRIAE